jgi:hypothetical protein
MSKSILTVGVEIASPDAKYESFGSRASLLDWDIVLFRPLISEYWSAYGDYYQGKPSLSDSSSFQLKEACEHWRREIKQAVETGKTVLVYLPAVQEVYIDTGERRYSGTGRNQKTTRIVSPYTNYAAIPAGLKPVNATGSSMKLAPLGAEILAPYWSEFGGLSEYKVLLTAESICPCISTKNGDKAVATSRRAHSFYSPTSTSIPIRSLSSKRRSKSGPQQPNSLPQGLSAASLHSTKHFTPPRM